MQGQPPSPPAFKAQTRFSHGIFKLPLERNEAMFNPALARDKQGTLWLFCRRNINRGTKEEYNDIVAYPIDRDAKVIGERKLIDLPQGIGLRGKEHFEDPRAMLLPSGNVLLSYCTFIPYGSWAHQAVAVLNGHDLSTLGRMDPVHGRNYAQAPVNDGHEKNWVWFHADNAVHCVYRHSPMEVVKWSPILEKEQVLCGSVTANWPWGEIRGGTNPVLVDGLWWTFFHSSTHWRDKDGKRLYHMAALAFRKHGEIYELERVSRSPILSGTYHGVEYDHRFPICVFPGGAECLNGEWFVSFGVNDILCGWIKIPHEAIISTSTTDLSGKDFREAKPAKRAARGRRRGKPVLGRVRRKRRASRRATASDAKPWNAGSIEHPQVIAN